MPLSKLGLWSQCNARNLLINKGSRPSRKSLTISLAPYNIWRSKQFCLIISFAFRALEILFLPPFLLHLCKHWAAATNRPNTIHTTPSHYGESCPSFLSNHFPGSSMFRGQVHWLSIVFEQSYANHLSFSFLAVLVLLCVCACMQYSTFLSITKTTINVSSISSLREWCYQKCHLCQKTEGTYLLSLS